jgi:hypothetical protein
VISHKWINQTQAFLEVRITFSGRSFSNRPYMRGGREAKRTLKKAMIHESYRLFVH